MKSLTEFINEKMNINEGGLESDKFLIVVGKDGSNAAKELEEDWADAILVSSNPSEFVYALPKDTAEAMKETYEDDIALYSIDIKEYPYLNNFEDAFQDGDVTIEDLINYSI